MKCDSKIDKFRIHCQELIISAKERNDFFQNKYNQVFHKEYFNFLLRKTNDFIDCIHEFIPKSKIEQVCQFKSYII